MFAWRFSGFQYAFGTLPDKIIDAASERKTWPQPCLLHWLAFSSPLGSGKRTALEREGQGKTICGSPP
jgi:hypothetical protein